MTKTEFSLQLVSQRYRDYLIADLQLTNSVIRALSEGSAIEDVAELLDTSVEDVRRPAHQNERRNSIARQSSGEWNSKRPERGWAAPRPSG